MKTPTSIVELTSDFALREINALELRIVKSEDDVEAKLWEQARQVVECLNAGMTQRQLASQWVNARTGEAYSVMHVNYTKQAFVQFTLQPRPSFRAAYNEVANAKKEKPCLTWDEESGIVASLEPLITGGNRFGTIYADPPWKYGNQATRSATDNEYPTMTVADIAALPVAEVASDPCHLHLWTTNAFLFDARTVMDAWGFEYKSCFVWVKPQMGIGNYWRVSHEFMLLGVKGKQVFMDHSLKSWDRLDRARHSAKPEVIRRMIERASPGPRLELFGRSEIENWVVLGNQVQRSGPKLVEVRK